MVLPVNCPFGWMFVGMLPEILFHIAMAVVSFTSIVAGCHIGGRVWRY
jgi:hypothetical protein